MSCIAESSRFDKVYTSAAEKKIDYIGGMYKGKALSVLRHPTNETKSGEQSTNSLLLARTTK